jgi:hypothetical protein
MHIFAAVALIAFAGYFAVALGFFPLTPHYIRIASLTLDTGLLSSAVAIVCAIVVVRQHHTTTVQISTCAVIGILLILISAFALYATPAI